MPINLPNFLNVPTQDLGLRNMFKEALETYKQGAEAKQLKPKLAAEQQQRELANKLQGHNVEHARMRNEFYPQVQGQKLRASALDIDKSEFENEHREEDYEREKMAELLKLGQAKREAERDAKNGDKKSQLELDALQARINKLNTTENANPIRNQRTQQLIDSNQWKNTPPSVKENIIGLGRGLGIAPYELTQSMINGETFEEVAARHGYSAEDIAKTKANYLAGSVTIRQQKQREANLAELNVLEEKSTEAIAPYIRQIAGYSPKAIIGFFGNNEDSLAKYLAGRSLATEKAALRLKVMGANVGQHALEGMVVSALENSGIPRSMISPKVYTKMNTYVREWLNEAADAASQEVYGTKENKKSNLSATEDSTEALFELAGGK